VVLTPLLLGLGIDELSVGAGLVLPVKRAVQSLDSSECAQFAQEVLSLQSADAILQRCNEVARAHYPELF
jgi:phosphoenolpyruvate-protein kinase (PTS system EI component)